MSDPVNSPAHYQGHASGLECVQLAELQMFNLGNAVKYCWRKDGKGNPAQDLAKAAWYLRREATRLEAESKLFERSEALDLVSRHEPGETPLSYVLSAMRGGGSPAALRYAAQRIAEVLPPGLLVGRYLVLRKHLTDGVVRGAVHTPAIESSLIDGLTSVWVCLGDQGRADLAVTLSRMGAEPITIEETDEMAKLVAEVLP